MRHKGNCNVVEIYLDKALQDCSMGKNFFEVHANDDRRLFFQGQIIGKLYERKAPCQSSNMTGMS